MSSSDQRLVLCTGNPGKVAELRAMLPQGITVSSLAELGLPSDLPETGDTLQANALEKARFVHDRTGLPCLADDTGLEVSALNGAPGVRSARYAGNAKDPVANMHRLLKELLDAPDRSARFRTVLAWVDDQQEQLFIGEVQGTIAAAPRGKGGFGYDPVFIPSGGELTFAEMTLPAKNALSHRARAMAAFLAWLTAHRNRS